MEPSLPHYARRCRLSPRHFRTSVASGEPRVDLLPKADIGAWRRCFKVPVAPLFDHRVEFDIGHVEPTVERNGTRHNRVGARQLRRSPSA